MLEFEDDTVGGGFGLTPTNAIYRSDLNDPMLANASSTQAMFELLHTFNFWKGLDEQTPNFRLVKSIVLCEGLPNELLSMSPCDLYVHLAAKYETEEH